MSICAHESFMSMLMKLSRARAREGVTRTTTIGQYASRVCLLSGHRHLHPHPEAAQELAEVLEELGQGQEGAEGGNAQH